MKKILISLISVLIFSGLFAQSAKSKTGEIFINRLKDGNFEMESPFLRVVISPKYGGKIVSLVNKRTLEELINFDTNKLEIPGIGEDYIDTIWPGSDVKTYNVKSVGLGKNEESCFIEFNFSIKEYNDQKDVLLRKKFTLSKNAPLISIEVELINNSGKTIGLRYGLKNWFSFGGNEANERTIWTSHNNQIEEIPFLPDSKEHGEILNPDGFIGLTAKDVKSSVVILFDKENVNSVDTYHSIDKLSLEINCKSIELFPKKSFLFKADILVMEDIKSFSAVNFNNNIVGSFKPEIKGNKLFISGVFYRYGLEELTDLKLKVSMLDENDKEIGVIAQERISTLSKENPYSFNVSTDISKLKLSSVKIFYQIFDSSDLPILTAIREVEITKPKITPLVTDKNLTVNVVFLFNKPYFENADLNNKNIESAINSYSNVLKFIEKKSKIKFDVSISGILLYNMIKNNPAFIESLNQLISKKNINLLATGFSYPIFPMISPKDIEYQIELDRNLKSAIFGVKPEGIFFPELAFDNTPLEPIVKNQITWCYFSDLSIMKGYKGFPGMNYYAPSRIMSTGFGLNSLIVDTKAKQILERKSEKAISDLINYLLEVQNKNKDGKNHVVLLIEAEKWNDISFLDKLFAALEELKWIKFASSDDIFKAFIPTQIILGEKISGSIYFDVEKMETDFSPWYMPESKKSDLRNLIFDTSDILSRNLEKISLAKQTYPEKDFSYAISLYENGLENYTLALQEGYLKGNNSENLKIAKSLIEKSRKTVAGVYDLLIGTIKDKKIKIPTWKEKSTPLPEEERANAFNRIKTKTVTIIDKKINPEKVTQFSTISIDFKLPDTYKNIDYNNIVVIFNVNNSDEMYQTKANLAFNGRIKATLGNAKTGDELNCYIYFKDNKQNSYISDKITIVVE
ncbi:MAG: hypothetical protein ACP5QT_08990 [Brevinematia bacterium]